MNARLTLLVVATSALFASCSDDAPRTTAPPGSTPAATTSTSESASSAATARPAPPLPAGAEKKPLPPTHPPIEAAKASELAFVAPKGWVKEEPSMPMRREQYRLPKQSNDKADATVTIVVLGAKDGGPIEPNLQRWSAQFAQPDGSKSRDALKQSSRKVGDMNVIEVELSGTYIVDETPMGGTNHYNEPGWRMLMSWVQSPMGNYYVKVVGPAATVGFWEPSFRQFVSSAAP